MSDFNVLTKISAFCDAVVKGRDERYGSFDDFAGNPQGKFSLYLCMMQLGEMSRYLSVDFESAHDMEIFRRCRELKSMYEQGIDSIDPATVWEAAKQTPEIKNFCERALAQERDRKS